MTHAEKVFCIGWAKTGTTSMGNAFQILGYTHTTRQFDLFEGLAKGDMSEAFAMADQYDAFDDWPWILLYEDMAERYPHAKFVLTLREEGAMVKSYRKMVAQELKRYSKIRDVRKYIYGFDTELGTNDQFLERVRKHNADVRHFFADKPDRLLEMTLAEGDGWEKLCPFLGKPVPDVPFPVANAASKRNPIKTRIRNIAVLMRSTFYRLRQST